MRTTRLRHQNPPGCWGGAKPDGKAGEQRGDVTQGPLGASLERTRVTHWLSLLGQGSWGPTPHLQVIRVGLLPWGCYSQVPRLLLSPGEGGIGCLRGREHKVLARVRGAAPAKSRDLGVAPRLPLETEVQVQRTTQGPEVQAARQVQGPRVRSLRSLWPPPPGRLPRLHPREEDGPGAPRQLRTHARRS